MKKHFSFAMMSAACFISAPLYKISNSKIVDQTEVANNNVLTVSMIFAGVFFAIASSLKMLGVNENDKS